MNTKTCVNCGDPITRPPRLSNWHWEKRRFCSNACQGALNRKTCATPGCDSLRRVGARCDKHRVTPGRLPQHELIRLRRLVNACEVCGGAMDHDHRETA